MYLQRLYIGLNDKDLHKQIISIEKAEEVIKNMLSDNYTSYTIIKCEGVFQKETEQTLIIEYISTSKECLISSSHTGAIASILNQLVILETIQEIEYNFI